MSGNLVGNPAGAGAVNGEKVGRTAKAYTRVSWLIVYYCFRSPSHGRIRETYSTARDLPVHSEILSSGRDEVGIPRRAGYFGILV